MEIIRCKNGHSYDPSVTPECPECARLRAEAGKTIPLEPQNPWVNGGTSFGNGFEGAEDIGKTQPVHGFGASETAWREQQPTEAADNANWVHWSDQSRFQGAANGDPGFPTRAKYGATTDYNKQQPINPVVGWLVCIEGPGRGRDYKIHADNNYIGRASHMDISIAEDDTISRENHAILAYDTRDRIFYFAPGSGRGIVRLNGKAVLMMTELHLYDRVEIGRSTFLFVPFCSDQFSWKEIDG